MGLYPVGVELLLGLPTLPAVGLAVEAWVGALLHNTPQPSYPRLTHIIPAIPVIGYLPSHRLAQRV
jgi:hypothetical protein